MKIKVISTDDKLLTELARLLRERSSTDDVSVMSASLERVLAIAELGDIDVLVLAQDNLSGEDVERLERLGLNLPSTAFILVSPHQTPELLMQAMRAGVREVVPSPPAATTLYPALRRIADKRESHANAGGKVLAFISCKGGSGATFLATNLGYALAKQEHKKVCLLDLNLQFGDASLFVSEQKPHATLADLSKQIHRLDASFLAGSLVNVTENFGILAAPEDPSFSEEVKPEHIDILLKLARRHYDFILLDIGRSLDAISVRALDQADMIYPILQTTLPYIRDGKRLLGVFHSLDYSHDKISLIVNRHDKSGQIKLTDLERAYGMRITLNMPNHYEAAAASVNQGVPILKLAPASPLSKALAEMAHALAGASAGAEKTRAGLLSRMFAAKSAPANHKREKLA
ncbi:MAG: AAA family ATPase [Pseudomonadota bacterium]